MARVISSPTEVSLVNFRVAALSAQCGKLLRFLSGRFWALMVARAMSRYHHQLAMSARPSIWFEIWYLAISSVCFQSLQRIHGKFTTVDSSWNAVLTTSAGPPPAQGTWSNNGFRGNGMGYVHVQLSGHVLGAVSWQDVERKFRVFCRFWGFHCSTCFLIFSFISDRTSATISVKP